MTMAMSSTTLDVPLRIDEHGKIRVGETRILLELVIHAFQQGEAPEEILESYPSLSLVEIYLVLAYYLQHREEVDRYLRSADAAVARIQRETEANYLPEVRALRARLRAILPHP